MTLREHLTLLHLPTTSVLLSIAVLGSSIAQDIYPDRLILFTLQIFLGGSVAANHFDELVDRPWHTKMASSRLWFAALIGLVGFIAIGLYFTLQVDFSFLFFVIVESFLIVAYDLEIFGGVFHNVYALGASWGLVFLGGYYLQDLVLEPLVIVATLLICGCSIQGIELYETGKSFGKDRRFANSHAKFAWKTLNLGILTVNAIAVILVIYRFWPLIANLLSTISTSS